MRHAFPTRRLRYLADVNPPVPDHVRLDPEAEYRLLPMEAIREFSAPDNGYKRPAKELLSGYSYIEPTDVAYAKVTPCFENGKGLVGADLDEPVFATTEVTVLRPRDGVDQKFLSYVVQSAAFRNPAVSSMTGAGGLKRVSESYIKDLPLPAPSAWMQQQIADFLAHETAEIDALLVGLESMKDLVVERSGAERDACIWSQDQPLIPLRRLIKYVDQGSSPQVMSSPAGPGEVGILKSGCTNFGIFNPEANKAVPTEMKIPEQSFVHEGDLVISRASGSTKHVGSSAVVPSLDRSLALSDKHYRLHGHDDVDVHYLAAVLRSRPFRNELEPYISGAPGLAKNISISSLKAMHVPHLSAEHQREISRRLQKSFEDVQEITCSIDHAIDLARERRAALITAAVTGQIDVTARNKPAAEQLEDDIAQGLHREYA
ncbi:hypothetical protein GCM10025781_00470 [Kocuria gwangalliensis]|uniref:Type I restriction modification DNA specificity domain-containing protein n=1 Tax=Kocuria gwangalliensis TaxID=501592 RepID=A0ABP8WGN6_9MICC